jgi:hypothetical protein
MPDKHIFAIGQKRQSKDPKGSSQVRVFCYIFAGAKSWLVVLMMACII